MPGWFLMYQCEGSDKESQVEDLKPTLNKQQYSNSNKTRFNNSNSTVLAKDVLQSIPDLVADPSYTPWFAKQLRRLGTTRFMELANKARAGSDTPAILFKWMLQNNEVVR